MMRLVSPVPPLINPLASRSPVSALLITTCAPPMLEPMNLASLVRARTMTRVSAPQPSRVTATMTRMPTAMATAFDGHPMTLRRMRRPANIEWVHSTIAKMRAAMPDLAIRSTFIVGYPGETEAEFQALLDFTRELEFDRVGAFTFSFEPGTTSESLGDPVPQEVKEERRNRLMEQQQPISLKKNQTLIGKRLDVLIEGKGDGISLGRSYRDAPEIDGLVLVEGDLPIGEIVPVRMTGAMAYDLVGTIDISPAQVLLGQNALHV